MIHCAAQGNSCEFAQGARIDGRRPLCALCTSRVGQSSSSPSFAVAGLAHNLPSRLVTGANLLFAHRNSRVRGEEPCSKLFSSARWCLRRRAARLTGDGGRRRQDPRRLCRFGRRRQAGDGRQGWQESHTHVIGADAKITLNGEAERARQPEERRRDQRDDRQGRQGARRLKRRATRQ